MNNKLRLISSVSLIASLGLFGCAEDEGDDTAGATDSSGETMTGGATDSTSGGTDATAGTAGATSEGTSTSAGTSTTTTGEPVANGESCMMDAECMSEKCFVVGILGGICGDCIEDADCENFGCSLPNPIAGEGSVCGDGMIGSGCETEAACSGGLLCATVLDVPGVLTASTCSDCDADEDCADGDICNPTYNVTEISGFKTCEAPGSVPDGEGCDFDAQNGACMNFCAGADVLGVLTLGVCSPCVMDTDCADGQTCEPPTADPTEGIFAGACVDPA